MRVGKLGVLLVIGVLGSAGCLDGSATGEDLGAGGSDGTGDKGPDTIGESGDGNGQLLSTNVVFELEPRDLTVSVDDAGSTHNAGPITTFAWSFGDGTTATGVTPPPHRYAAAGTHTITLTVTTASGASASASRTVTVAQRNPGDYAPGDATTGVPDVVADRLHLLDLEKPNKSSVNTPSAAEETVVITKSGDTYKLTWNGNPVTLPAAHAYNENGQFVLDRLHVRGYVNVRAPNVTIRRSVVEAVSIPEAPDSAAPSGVDVGRRIVRGNDSATTGLILEDIEIRVPEAVRRGANINAAFHHGMALEASRLHMLRSEIDGSVDGMQIHAGSANHTSVVIERSWIHDMQYYLLDSDRADGDPTHSDAIQVECSLPAAGKQFGVELLGNTLDLTNDPNLTAAIMVTRNACATSGLRIENNFLDGSAMPINIGGGTSTQHITLYVNGNRFGPNRAAGTAPNKTWKTTTTAAVVAAKSNTDSSAAYENYDTTRPQSYVYLSYDPPTTLGATPPTGEQNRNVMVEHARGTQTWGTSSLGTAKFGLY
ncbi:PKD domain-containing protein [Polyangium jinanense]|uniref:PKD domain-containing protein n=1 Tax=Polyangium jinanense TaxID=2829994 RepID=A0A9X4AVN8_9BACT|nr:PKD domain-containing protein [Polyangium jinanense]MDC3961165.1 PKD domain-containing protein [Polyangium jinanense]MDC3986468.1 PKD domain-containing protein [Polyangium jinanense]